MSARAWSVVLLGVAVLASALAVVWVRHESRKLFVTLQALERTRGNLGSAARLLGLSYKTLQYRARKHGLDREAFDPENGTAAPPRFPHE